jgi:hypothetical protein
MMDEFARGCVIAVVVLVIVSALAYACGRLG